MRVSSFDASEWSLVLTEDVGEVAAVDVAVPGGVEDPVEDMALVRSA